MMIHLLLAAWNTSHHQTVINSRREFKAALQDVYQHGFIAAAICSKPISFCNWHRLVSGPQIRDFIVASRLVWLRLLYHPKGIGSIVMPDMADATQQFDGNTNDSLLFGHSQDEFVEGM